MFARPSSEICVETFSGEGPRMRLASFDKSENGHERSERGQSAVFNDLFKADRFGSSETAAINVHVQKKGARNDGQESQHDQSDDAGPDPKAPANQQQQSENDFGEGQGMRDETYSPGREQFVRFHLVREIREVGGDREFQDEQRPQVQVWKKDFCVTSVNKNPAKDQAADPDYRATKVEGAGLHHEVIPSRIASYFWFRSCSRNWRRMS